MSRIAIRGMIVPSVYDDAWLADDIDKGLFTPLSRVERALDEAEQEPLTLYINSNGGSVFAAHEMLNAIAEWRKQSGQPVDVTVGAMAASAASTIATMLGPVKAHQNAMFMFHGAQSGQLGGAQAMSDMGQLLEKINGQVVSALVSKYGMDPYEVAEWFAEGRMGWLTAQEAQAAGLVSEIIPADGDVIEFPQADIEKYQSAGLAVAALLEINTNTTQETDMNILQTIAEKLGMKPEQAKDETTVVQGLETKLAELTTKTEAAYDEGMAAGKVEGAKAAKAELAQKLTDLQAALDAAQADKTAAEQKATDLQAKLDTAEQRIAQIDRGFGGDSDDPAGDAMAQYWQAVKDLTDDGHSQDAAQLKVQRESPALYKAMIEQANKRN